MPSVPIAEASGADERYFSVADLAGIVAGVQMGVLEFHIWGCAHRQAGEAGPARLRSRSRRRPRLRRRAPTPRFDVRDRLAALGLTTFAHADRRQGHPRRRAASAPRRMAGGEEPSPKASPQDWQMRLPTAMSPTWPKRSARAASSSTTSATSAARPRSRLIRRARAKNAPVATPLAWEEVERASRRERLHRPVDAGARTQRRRPLGRLFRPQPIDHQGA